MILEVKNLKKEFCKNGACVANSLNIEIKKGEIFTLLGKSGSGKSTLLRMIAGFEIPDSGEIVVDGRIVYGDGVSLEPKERELSIVFQNYALFPHLSVRENILFGLKESHKKEFESVVEKVGLEYVIDSLPHEISGGQQQRTALARAIIRSPKLLLLDEPLSNIDTELRATLRQELKSIIKKFGITALFVTHDREDAFYISDRIAVMSEGRILQVDTSRNIYKYPHSKECATFLGKVNILQDGDKALYVRPEAIKIIRGKEGSWKVVESIFYGSYSEYILQKGDEELVVHSFFDEAYEGECVDIEFLDGVPVLT